MKKVSRKKKSSPGVTKADLARVESKLIKHFDSKLTSQITDAKSELIRYIDLKNEQLLYDFRGIFGDRTEQQDEKIADHERRIHQVERKLELAA